MTGIALCRASGMRQPLIRHLFSASLNTQLRASSLSAIHRGVRRSQRAQDEDAFSAMLMSRRRGSEWDQRGRRTAKAIGGISSPRQAQKLRKKLDAKAKEREEAAEGESTRQTRRKRFLDPSKSFGKSSLVYQLKHGDLKAEASSLKLRQPERPAPYRSIKPDRGQGSGSAALERAIWGERASKREESDGPGPALGSARSRDRDSTGRQERSIPSRRFQERRPFERGQSSGRSSALEQTNWGEQAPKREGFVGSRPTVTSAASVDRDSTGRDERSFTPRRSEESRPRRSEESRLTRPEESRPWRSEEPEEPAEFERLSRRPQEMKPNSEISRPHPNDWEDIDDQNRDGFRGRDPTLVPIKYTTAASQFLYGKSVVKAALEQHRRKLYNLYIYAGDRKDSKEDAIIASMAESRGVQVTMVPRGDQSIMDKMSMGRPHNGFILEASPLQQPPITSLGRLEESLGKLGFHIELGYQSKEEEAVNGLDTFVARKSDVTPKPFVLLLSEILDPGNLGGLLRTASYLGVDAVVMTNRSSATLTPVVLKSAAGAAEEVSIFTVDSPVDFIERSREAGWKTYAAVAPPNFKLAKMHEGKFLSTNMLEQHSPLFKNPCILVLGNEGHGLSKQIKMAADYELSVPRFVRDSSVDSLNVSVAAGLLCHAFVKAPSRRKRIMPSRSREVVPEQMEEKEEEAAEGEEKLF